MYEVGLICIIGDVIYLYGAVNLQKYSLTTDVSGLIPYLSMVEDLGYFTPETYFVKSAGNNMEFIAKFTISGMDKYKLLSMSHTSIHNSLTLSFTYHKTDVP